MVPLSLHEKSLIRPKLFLCLSAVIICLNASSYSARQPDDDAAKISWLIMQLGNRDFRQRSQAHDTLRRKGESILPVLRSFENDPDPEVRRRVQGLISSIVPGKMHELHRIRGLSTVPVCLAVSSDGSLLAAAFRRESSLEHSVVQLWNWPKESKSRRLAGEADEIMALAFSTDGHLLASAGCSFTVLWRTDTGTRMWSKGNGTTAVSFSPGDRSVVAGEFRHSIPVGITTPTHFGVNTIAAYSPDNQCLLEYSDAGVVCGGHPELMADVYEELYSMRIWLLTNRSVMQRLKGHRGRIDCLCYSVDALHCHSVSLEDKTARTWNAHTGKETGRIMLPPTVKSAVVQKDRLLVGCSDGTVSCWDLMRGKLLQTSMAHVGGTSHVAFSDDARFGVSCGDDCTLAVWRIE
jgi:WD40 repeat protein